MKGYIFLNRDIINHWIWLNPRHCQWWIYLLISAAWEPRTVAFGKDTYNLKRGQLATTVRQLMGRWQCYGEAVLDFLRVLESNEMITREVTSKMTIITICNYDKYQSGEDVSERKPKRKAEHLKEIRIEENKTLNTLSPSREQDLSFYEDLLNSDSFWEQAAISIKLSIDDLKLLAEQFKNEMLALCKFHSSNADYRQHFFNWAKIEIRKGGGVKKFKNQNVSEQTESKHSSRRAAGITVRTADEIRASFQNKTSKSGGN